MLQVRRLLLFTILDTSDVILMTTLGGINFEVILSMQFDSKGNLHFTGQTSSPDFPTTCNTFYCIVIYKQADAYFPTFQGTYDVFVGYVSLYPSGIVFAFSNSKVNFGHISYFGGAGEDYPTQMAIDNIDDSIYVVGNTVTEDFPIINSTNDRPSNRETRGTDIFLIGYNKNYAGVRFSTVIGGAGHEYGISISLYYPIPGLSSGVVFIGGFGERESVNLPRLNPLPYTAGMFLGGYLPNGTRIWTTYLGSNTNQSNVLVQIGASTAQKTLAVCGYVTDPNLQTNGSRYKGSDDFYIMQIGLDTFLENPSTGKKNYIF